MKISPPVVTPAVDPTGQHHLLPLVAGAQFTAGMSLEHGKASVARVGAERQRAAGGGAEPETCYYALMKPDPLSLYLHIPFCSLKCRYCDFNAYAGLDKLVPPYVDALIAEMGLWRQAVRGRPVPTVFFGGGTPSLLPLPELERIIAALRDSFDLDPEAELTLEANPGTVDLPYLQRLLSLGVNRLSLGVQSFHDDELAALDRIHSAQDAKDALSVGPPGRIPPPQPRPHLWPVPAAPGALAGHPGAGDRTGTRPPVTLRPHGRGGHRARLRRRSRPRAVAGRRCPGLHVRVVRGTAGPSGLPPVRDLQLGAARPERSLS